MKTIYRIKDGREFENEKEALDAEEVLFLEELSRTSLNLNEVCKFLHDESDSGISDYHSEREQFIRLVKYYIERKDNPTFVAEEKPVAKKLMKKKGKRLPCEEDEDE